MRVGTVKGAVAVSYTIGKLESPVEPFDVLLEPSVLCRDRILVGETKDLCKPEEHILHCKLLVSEIVDGIAIRNKPEGFTGEILKMGKGPAHGKHARLKGSFR